MDCFGDKSPLNDRILFLFVADLRLNCKIFVKKLNFLRESSKFKKNQSKFFIQLQCVIFKNP